jgi:peptidyl-prolyl cis-trans isomerase C
MKVSAKVLVVIAVIVAVAGAALIAQRASSSAPRSSNLSAADMEMLVPEILPPEAQAQYAKPEQKKELVKQLRHVLAIADLAEREGYAKRPDVKTQIALMADSRLARAYATKNPDKSVGEEELKSYIDTHEGEINGYLDANPRLKKEIEGAQLDSFKQTYARIRLMANKARESGIADDKTSELLEYWSSREVLYQAYVDEMIANYYNEHKNEYEQVRARHILISTSPPEETPPQAGEQDKEAADKKAKPLSKEEARKKAESILARVRKGEDFAKLAGEFSDDGSKEMGGDLEYFSRGRMVPEFEQAAFALKPGEVSDLVETQYGFHIIKVEDRRAAPVDDPTTQQQILAKLQPELEKLAESSSVKVAEDFNFTPKTPPQRRGMPPGGVPNPHGGQPPQ